MNLLKKVLNIFAVFYSLLIAIAVWEIIARSGLVPFFFLPPLSIIASTFVTQLAEGSLVQEASLTTFRAVAGFAIAVSVGVMFTLDVEKLNIKIKRVRISENIDY